ncbi:hypothetical protein [Ramlibacter sp.]|uniref:hypothetical protein n=1 Tax=Ramlibacter sp. TaxID=1917967 RepID=UPI002C14C63B|nr:hypothetical protein [Ramlibacter sp.]HWI80815.1 hypothetical protein [Ramlibacter sp.]
MNTTTGGDQTALAIGALAGGGYAVAWAGAGGAGQIAVQRYDAAGARVDAETLIAFDLAQHPDAALAVRSDGSVLVAYTASRVVAGSTYPTEVASVLTQRFDAGGAAAGAALEVAALAHSGIAQEYTVPAHPGLLAWPDGSYAVTWDVLHVRGGYGTTETGALQGFDSAGAASGGARFFGVDATGSSAAFAAVPEGGAVFVEHYVAAGQYLARFTPFDALERTTAVTAAADGTPLPGTSVLLPLHAGGYALSSTDHEAAYVQLLDDAGAALGPRVPLGQPAQGGQALADGGFVLFWPVAGQDALGADLAAQRFDHGGAPVGGEMRIETNGGAPLVTALADGGWAFAWTATGADGSLDVYTQRFAEGGGAAQPLDGSVALAGSASGEHIAGLAGDDLLHGTAGNDTIDGAAGTDTVVLDATVGAVHGYAMAAGALTLTTAAGTDTLLNVERVRLADALFALDTQAPDGAAAGGHAWQAAALLRAAFGDLPDQATLSRWTAQADHAGSMGGLGQSMIDAYAPGAAKGDIVEHVLTTLFGSAPDAHTVQAVADQIGAGRQFGTAGDALAYAATLAVNTDHLVGFTGSIQQLDAAWF